MAAVELSVFGLGSSLDITVETLALTGVVGFTVVFEMCAHRLEHTLAGTPYMGMLSKIYKELMIMGVISLGVFLVLELGSVSDAVGFHAFEFAHIVIFFAALIFVFQACLMMIFSAKLKNRYERSTNIRVDHLLSIYSLHRKSKVFHARWLPISDLREVMEFKIVHAFFRKTFALPTSFDFALYMREASDNYILSLVDVEGSTWLVLAIVCFLNLARVKLWKFVFHTDSTYEDDDHATDDHATDDHNTDDHTTDDHRRSLASSSSGNTGSDGELTFIAMGWALLGVAIANYFFSRWSEIRLLRKAECNSTHDYDARLCVIEKEYMEAKRAEERNRKVGLSGHHLEKLRLQVDKAKGEGGRLHRHRKGAKTEGSEILRRKLSQHMDMAKNYAKTVSIGARAGELMRGLNSPQRVFTRGAGGNKVLPAVGDTGNDSSTTDLPQVGQLLSRGHTSPVLEYKTQQPQGSTPVSRSEITGSWRSSISATEKSMDVPWPVVVEATADRAHKKTDQGGIPATSITPSSVRNSDGCEDEAKIPAAPGGSCEYSARGGREGGGGGQGHEDTDDSERFEDEDEDGRENRYVMVMPPLMPEINESSPSQSPSRLIKVGEPAVLEEDTYSFDEGFSFQNFGGRENRNGGQLPLGRRASLSIQNQARRMSFSARKVTMKLATDVTKAAKRMSAPQASAQQKSPSLTFYNDISDIYPLSSPVIFHKTLDVLLLFSCTYLALWAVNFLPVANEKPYSFLRHAGMLLPAAGVFLFNALSVKTSSLLLAISAMDPEIIGKVLDEQIDQEKLVAQFRERLVSRLDEIGMGKSGLTAVFEEMDVTNRGELTIKELSKVLFTLNFHTSKEKYRKLFNVMDTNRLGVVSYHQLFGMVYNQEAASQEERALKMKGKLHAIK